MKTTKHTHAPEDIWTRWKPIGDTRASLLARAEKAEQERDQALEKARDRECARVIETDRADGISETLQEARKHIDELEEKYTDTRLAVVRLKAAQRPRPMDEAPRDGTPIRVIHGVQFWAGDGWIFTPNKDRSWLPLPDQDEKSTS